MFDDGLNVTAAGMGLLVGALALASVTSKSLGWGDVSWLMKLTTVVGSVLVTYIVVAIKTDGGV